MRRLNRNVSENSLRLYLKKFKSRQLKQQQQQQQSDGCNNSLNDSLLHNHPPSSQLQPQPQQLLQQQQQRNMVPPSISTAAINTTSLLPNEFTYYLSSGNQFHSPAPGSMIYVSGANATPESTLTLVNPLLDYNRRFGPPGSASGTPSTSNAASAASRPKNPAPNSNSTSSGNGGGSGGRRRINWNDADVQRAICDFYARQILTQAKLRSIIEGILGEVVSEQALSIYLKRKVSFYNL